MSGPRLIRRPVNILLLVAFFIGTAPGHAEKYASIIIDDLGNSRIHSERVLELSGPLTLAILPHTRFAASLATRAHKDGKEVMLHLPLQSVQHHSHTPGTLTLHMTRARFIDQLDANLRSIPHIRGINNHMGSLLTQHPGHMDWLMAELSRRDGLYFIDSRTTRKSVVAAFADKYDIPHMPRDIFLDPDFRPDTIRRQFARFVNRAYETGFAIAIAHPHPRTLQFIQDNLEQLEKNSIKLVVVSELIKQKLAHEGMSDVASTGTIGGGM